MLRSMLSAALLRERGEKIPMPVYYFHVRDSTGLLRDPDGIELPDMDSVRDEVRNSILSVLGEEPKELLADREFQIEDAFGRVVLLVPFRVTYLPTVAAG